MTPKLPENPIDLYNSCLGKYSKICSIVHVIMKFMTMFLGLNKEHSGLYVCYKCIITPEIYEINILDSLSIVLKKIYCLRTSVWDTVGTLYLLMKR